MSTPSATGAAEAQGETLNRSGSAIEHAVASRPHERLTRAMLEVSAEAGCRQASIARVAARAGMSSATFYEQFTGRKSASSRRTRWRPASLRATWRKPREGQVRAAASRPRWRRCWTTSPPTPRPDISCSSRRRHRNAMVAKSSHAMSASSKDYSRTRRAGARSSTCHTAPRSVRCAQPYPGDLGRRMRRPHTTRPRPRRMAQNIRGHVRAMLEHLPGRGLLPDARAIATRQPNACPPTTAPLSPGRHGLSAARVAQNHRERIVHAVAAVVLETGYAKMTVADIVLRAGIARDAFYRQHEDKRDAFLAAQLHGRHENTLAAARGYFEGRTWTERMWNLLQSHATFIAEQPALAHLRYVEPAVVGREAVAGLEEEMLKFATYVSEGYRHGARATQMPALSAEAITGAIFEILRHEIAQRRADTILRRLPQLTYIATAPFIGQRRAIREVERVALARVRQ